MVNFPPEKSILHIVSKAQIRLSSYWRSLWRVYVEKQIHVDAYQSGITIHPLPIPVFQDYTPFKWRLTDEVGFHSLGNRNDSTTILGYEILWYEDLWAISSYAELLSYNNKYHEPLREPIHIFTKHEAKTLDELRNSADLALDELIYTQKIRDNLFNDKVSYEMIDEIMQKYDWSEEPRKSLFS